MPSYEEAKSWCGWATGCRRSKYYGFPPDAVVRDGAGWERNLTRKANDLLFEYGVQHTSTMRGFKDRAERHYYSIVRKTRPANCRSVLCTEEVAASLFGLIGLRDEFVAWLAMRRLGSAERFDLPSLLRPEEKLRRVFIAEFGPATGRAEEDRAFVQLASYGGDDKAHEYYGSVSCPMSVVRLLQMVLRDVGVECWMANVVARRTWIPGDSSR